MGDGTTAGVEWLFSYGTLRDPAVQQATFGRVFQGHADALIGYATQLLEITDPDVLATSGQTHHPIVVHTGLASDTVPGQVLELTAAELAAADDYEVDDYERARTTLASGLDAWVYVQRPVGEA